MMKNFAGMSALVAAAGIATAPAQAQEVAAGAAPEEIEVPYDIPLRCAVLSTVFAAAEDGEGGDKQTEAYHNDRGQRFLHMAMVRDGAKGEKAAAEFEPLIGRLVTKIDSFGEDQKGLEEFLTEGATACAELSVVFKDEFDAVKIETRDTTEE